MFSPKVVDLWAALDFTSKNALEVGSAVDSQDPLNVPLAAQQNGNGNGGAPFYTDFGSVGGRYRALDRVGAGCYGSLSRGIDMEMQHRIMTMRENAARESGGAVENTVNPKGRGGDDNNESNIDNNNKMDDEEEDPYSDLPLVAIKRLRLGVEYAMVLREASLHRRMHHQNIVRMRSVMRRDDCPEKLFVIMEYLPVDLRTYVNAFICPHHHEWGTAVPQPYMKAVLRDVLRGLAYMHGRGVVHRDLKPENVLVEPTTEERLRRSVFPRSFTQRETKLALRMLHCDECYKEQTTTLSLSSSASHLAAHNIPNSTAGDPVSSSNVGINPTPAAASQDERHMNSADRKVMRAVARAMDEMATVVDTPQEVDEANPTTYGHPLLGVPIAKIGDLGSARTIVQQFESFCEVVPPMTGQLTTKAYRAPEMLLGHAYGYPVDVWAVGAMLFECVMGELLLSYGIVATLRTEAWSEDASDVQFLMAMLSRLGTPTTEQWKAICDDTVLPQESREQLPQVRNSFLDSEEIFSRIGSDGVDLLKGLLEYNPRKRLTAKMALQHPFLAI